MKFRFKVSGSKELARELKAAKDNIRKEVEEEIVETLEATKSDVVSRVPSDTGNLASSFNIEGSNLKYSLYTNENYAGYLEFGTRSRFETGMPEEWQEEARKFQDTSKGSFKEAKKNITEWARRKGIPENEIASVIFAIMRYGIRSPRFNPKPFFRPAVAQNVTGVEERIEERIQTQLNKNIMRDVHKELRTAYASVLLNKITYNSRNVPVFAKYIPVTAEYPLILITNQFGVNDSSKNSFETSHTIDVEIVDRSTSGGVGSSTDDISNMVLQTLATMDQSDYPVIGTGLFITDLYMSETNELFDRDATHTYSRRVITFVNEIQEID